MYNFETQLAKSESPTLEPGWLAAYAAQFPGMRSAVKMTDSLFVQQLGFDRVVVDTTRTWNIEEKVDFYDNDRVVLEYVSNTASKKLGWVVKPNQADFIAYRKAPHGQVWFWSVPLVRRAWAMHGEQMIAHAKARNHGFVFAEAQNPGYTSLSVCAPIKQWERALTASSEVKF